MSQNNLPEVLLFSVVGFCAQMIDGCLGMAYGFPPTRFSSAREYRQRLRV